MGNKIPVKGDGDSKVAFLLLGGGCCSWRALSVHFVFCNHRIFHCLPSSNYRPLISRKRVFWLWEILTKH